MIKLIPSIIEDTHVEAVNDRPYGIDLIHAPQLWDIGYKGAGEVVAILDTGCNMNHPEFAGRIIGSKNFTLEGGLDDVSDLHGHGTHVTGTTIGATVGVAPGASALILKVLDKNGQGAYDGIVAAINFARNWRGPRGEKVRVITMSLGGPAYDPLHQAIKNAVSASILVTCAAGNEGDGNSATNEYAYPGAYSEVVCVGAIDEYVTIAPFSDSNEEVDLVAPGVAIKSAYQDSYVYMSGTSMATPHIAGAALLITQQWEKDYGRTISEAELYAQLIRRCQTLGNDKKAEGAGVLVLTHNYAKPLPYESLTIEQAIAKLTEVGAIETPAFWMNLVAKFDADPVKYDDFRYVGLLIRKMAARGIG